MLAYRATKPIHTKHHISRSKRDICSSSFLKTPALVTVQNWPSINMSIANYTDHADHSVLQKYYTMSQKCTKKCTNFETVHVKIKIIRIDFDDIWQKYSKYTRTKLYVSVFM